MVKTMFKIFQNGLLLLSLLSELKSEVFLIADYNLSARSAGLRNTDIAMSAKSSSVFSNPALLADINRVEGGSSLNKGFGEQSLTSMYAVYPLADFTVGGGIAYLGYGDFKSYNDQLLEESEMELFSAYDFLMVGSISKNVYENLNAGANVKFYNSKIDQYSSSAIGLDLTSAYKMLNNKISLAAGVYNLAYQIDAYNETKENLPLTVKTGISNRFEKMPLELSLQYNYSVYGESWYSAGLEFKPKPAIQLRAGYDFSSKDKKIGTASQSEKFAGLALGGSAIFKYFGIDLAYQINGELEENWTFAINGWLFENKMD